MSDPAITFPAEDVGLGVTGFPRRAALRRLLRGRPADPPWSRPALRVTPWRAKLVGRVAEQRVGRVIRGRPVRILSPRSDVPMSEVPISEATVLLRWSSTTVTPSSDPGKASSSQLAQRDSASLVMRWRVFCMDSPAAN